MTTGYAHSCALRSDGQAICWGAQMRPIPEGVESDQYDYGQAESHPGPFRSIEAGGFHTCGVRRDDSTVECWGASLGDPEDGPFYGQCEVPVVEP